MHRRALWIVAALGCDATIPATPPPAPTYPAPAVAFELGADRGRFGRSQAPEVPVRLPIGARAMPPLTAPTLWPVPGKAARAIVRGTLGDGVAIEAIDVDTGAIAWRDKDHCTAIVRVTDESVICADANGVRAIGLDGTPRWSSPASYLAATGERIATSAGASELAILDADRGDELGRVKLPPGVESDSVLATCGDVGREVFARGRDGKLQRVAPGQGGSQLAWSVAVDSVETLDACDGDTVLVATLDEHVVTLTAIARATGKVTGQLRGVTGWWAAPGAPGMLDVATRAATLRWPRDLSAPRGMNLPPLGELLDARGDRRLVRATQRTAALLDATGVIGYVALADGGAVLGDRAILAGDPYPGYTARRVLIPPPRRRALRPEPAPHVVMVPAPLRDVPDPQPPVVRATLERAGVVGGLALAGDELYIATRDPGDERGAVVRADARAGTFGWQRADGCTAGEPRGLAIAAPVVACAVRGKASTVRATARADGAAAWQWDGDNVDGVRAAADAVVVLDADRAIVLDAATGHALGEFAADGGGPAVAAIADAGGAARLYTVERGRLVARVPSAGLAPLWSLGIDGAVDALVATGGGVLVALEDGDAYRVDEDGSVVAVAGLGFAWSASDDVLLGGMPGDVIAQPMPTGMPAPAPLPPGRRPPLRPPPRVRPPEALADDAIGPPLSTPVALPAPIGRAWQLDVYERGGAIRVRNDYALDAPVTVAPRTPGAPVVLVGAARAGFDALALDPRTGDPIGHTYLPPDAAAFATVDGAGAVLSAPLRIVRF